jgi:hypothetical protein
MNGLTKGGKICCACKYQDKIVFKISINDHKVGSLLIVGRSVFLFNTVSLNNGKVVFSCTKKEYKVNKLRLHISLNSTPNSKRQIRKSSSLSARINIPFVKKLSYK